MNALEYLVDDDHLLEARGKELKLRLLDAGRVKKESSFWKGVNIIVPIVLILILGSVYIFFRKRRYAK
jgi:ABC-2 type transport system permease protein